MTTPSVPEATPICPQCGRRMAAVYLDNKLHQKWCAHCDQKPHSGATS